jgi:hypothetical protein
MKKIILQIALVIAIILNGCSVPVPKLVTPASCKSTVTVKMNTVADELCPHELVKWDDCEFRESILIALDKGLEACDAIR